MTQRSSPIWVTLLPVSDAHEMIQDLAVNRQNAQMSSRATNSVVHTER